MIYYNYLEVLEENMMYFNLKSNNQSLYGRKEKIKANVEPEDFLMFLL